MQKPIVLNDWMTTPNNPFFSKTTCGEKDDIYHSHEFYEIFYITNGKIPHMLNGVVSEIQESDIFFLNTMDCHAFLREPDNRCTHRDIIIRKEFFEEMCNFISPNFLSTYNSGILNKRAHIPVVLIGKYESRLSKLSILQNANNPYINAEIKSLCFSLLDILISEYNESEIHNYPKWLEDFLIGLDDLNVLRQDYNTIISSVHFNNSYACRTFRKYLGCTITDYINNLRLEHAATLLRYSDDSILSVSHEVGFSSISHFNTLFKAKFNSTPSNFRG